MSDLIKRLRDDRHRWFNRPLNDGELRIWHLLCCEAADELERRTAEHRIQNECIADQHDTIRRLRAALEDTRKKYRWLKSKARVKSRDFEEPQYAWSIHWRSTCATVENAIKQALQGDSDE